MKRSLAEDESGIQRGGMFMRRPRLLFFIVAICMLVWFGKAWSDAPKEREAYREEIGKPVEKLESRVDDLKEKGEDLKGEARKEFKDQMDLLQEKRKLAKEKYHQVRSEFKDASDSVWAKLKSDMDAVLNDAESSYDRTVSRYDELKAKK
jgi:hypothetical protein